MKDVASLVRLEQDILVRKAGKQIPLSATLLASVLLALSPKEHVLAQEIEDEHAEIESKYLYEKYHSLLNGLDQENEEQADEELELNEELSTAEVKAVQEQLILFIENKGDLALAEKMKVEVSTINELEELVNSLFETPATTDEAEELIQDEELVEKDEDLEQEPIEEEQVEAEELPIEKEPADMELAPESITQPAALSIENPTTKSVSYIVSAGDTLNKIARAHNVTVNHLAELNNIRNVNSIRIGQELIIQGSKLENEALDDLAKLEKPMTKNEFIDVLGEHAAVAAKEQNLYASVMIAQGALESGFGTSGLSSTPNHNLYGMKGRYEGDSVLMRTREYSTAKGWHYVNAHFKKYPSYLESVLDHSAYIRRGTSWAPDYYSGVWRENTTSYQDATLWLQGRYATDPAYASKLNRIIEMYDLTRFDEINEDGSVIRPPVDNIHPDQVVKPSTGDKIPNNTEVSTYQVKRGDTLSRIALNHKMSVRELKELNSLQSDLILVGQRLKVKKNVVPVKPTPTPEKPVRPSESNTINYTVKPGDTLSQIAPVYKMSVRELKDLNNLKSDLIFIGQKLKVKSGVVDSVPIPKPTSPKPTAPIKPSRPSTNSYAVKRGDTLSQIARVYQTSVRELKELNNLKSDLIFVGQQLKINQSSKGSSNVSVQNYQIKAGDTLSAIARRFNTTVKKLKETNKLRSDLIYVNQRLTI